MLRVDGLTKRFGALPVLEGFDLRVEPNGFTVLIGPSGCGKTTLFDVLTGVVTKDDGEILWQGRAFDHLGGRAAYMQQKDLLLPWLSLAENALLPVRLGRSADLDEARRRVWDLFQRLGLGGFEAFRPAAVSGGMRQRCALVRTLMFDRELVLLDEPLSALDAITRRSLQTLLLLLQHDFGRTLLMITHDIEEALLLGDRVLILSAAPLRVIEEIVVPGPKPRDITDPALIRIKARALDRLQKEFSRAAA